MSVLAVPAPAVPAGFLRHCSGLGSLRLLCGGGMKWSSWKGAALGAAGILVFSYLYDLIWMAHWRPEINQFVSEHATEIERAG